MSLFCAKRLLQWGHLLSRHLSCTVRACASRLLGDGNPARQCGQGCARLRGKGLSCH